MIVGTKDGVDYVNAPQISLAINESGEEGSYTTTAYIQATHVDISATDTVHTLAGDIEHDAQGRLVIKNAGGMYVEKTEQGVTSYFGVWNDGNVTGLTVSTLINEDSSATINASKIYLLGETIANTITADYIASKVATLTILQVQSLGCSGGASVSGLLNAAGNITTPSITLDGVSVGAAVYDVRITGPDANNLYTLQKQTITGSGWTDVGTFERGDTEAAYNQGWNDCIDAASGDYYLGGYSNWNNGVQTTLYYFDTSSLTYKAATGGGKVWRYGGSTAYRYTLPNPK